jgi:PAS domain S-box-containing protein
MDRWGGVPYVDETRLRTPVPAPRAPDPDGAAGAARLALVARHTADAVVIYRPDGRVDWVNEAFEKMTGLTLSEVAGADRLDFVWGPFTKTAEFASLREDLAAGRDASVEFVTRTKQGAPYWVAMQVRSAVQDGEVIGLVGVERDISARRHAEERAVQSLRRAESLAVALRHEKRLLTTVLATVPHLVWWKNCDLRYIGANPAYLAFRGLGSPAEVVGRRDDQLDTSAASLGPDVAQLEAGVLASHHPVAERTVSVTGAGGEPKTFLVSVLPHRDGEKFAGVIGIGADVSQVAALERQLAQTSRLESIGQLAAGIAHEINTPVQYVSDNTRFVASSFRDVLAGLQELAALVHGDGDDAGAGPGQVLKRVSAVLDGLDLGFVADEVPSAIEQSLEGLERVGGIVKAMKDFSHPGQERADVDLNRVVDSTLQVSRSEWKYVAELTLDLDPATGKVLCYEGEIKQVLLNVVVNAAHAIGERREAEPSLQGQIVVSTRRTPGEVLIAVRDNGIGMDEAIRSRVFDPFFTTKPVGKGTGQGMSIAHSIVVVKHGGRIEIDSKRGEGTTFTVALPLTPAGTAAPAGPSADPFTSPGTLS